MEFVIENENIKRISKNKFYYYGYYVYSSGKIMTKNGRELSAYNFAYPYSHVTLRIDGKNVKKNKAALVYELFSGKKIDPKRNVVCFKDGDSRNAAYRNIKIMSKKDYWKVVQKRGKVGVSKFDKEQGDEIKRTYALGVSQRKLAAQYNCCLSTIGKILGDKYNYS